jgi:hypothetical protein
VTYPFISFQLAEWGEDGAEMHLFATPAGTLAGAVEPVLIGRRRFSPNPAGLNEAVCSLETNELHEHLYAPNTRMSYTVIADKVGEAWQNRNYVVHRSDCQHIIRTVGFEDHTFISVPTEYDVCRRIFDFFGGGVDNDYDEPRMYAFTDFDDCVYESTFAPLFVEEGP